MGILKLLMGAAYPEFDAHKELNSKKKKGFFKFLREAKRNREKIEEFESNSLKNENVILKDEHS